MNRGGADVQLRGGRYEYLAQHVEGEYAFLLWRAKSGHARIEHGVDSFVIRGGRIVMQTVHYDLPGSDSAHQARNHTPAASPIPPGSRVSDRIMRTVCAHQ